MNKKIHFVSLGCPRNLVDSEVMLGLILRDGFEITALLKEADYLVVNTCAFLASARRESKDTLSDFFSNKKKTAKIIVTGCMVSKHRKELEKMFPDIHYFLGSGDIENILQAIKSDIKGEKIGDLKSYLEMGDVPRRLSTPGHYAYLKISEGCRKWCSYCIIPQIKGPLRSKPIEQVLGEFKSLLSIGVKEIILVAQDLGDYGKDLGNKKLTDLLKELLRVDGDFWIRLLYLYPDEIDDSLIQLMKSDKRILPYLDMPIQHINDTILQKMRRQTTSNQIKEIIFKLRNNIEKIHIRTSLIVGFPGESEEQFEELCLFLKEFSINHVGIFKYSREKETSSFDMTDQIPEKCKREREARLSLIQQKNVFANNEKMVGQTLEVVVDGYHPETDLLLVGRYFGQAPEIDGQVVINDWRSVSSFGERYSVEITKSLGYDLMGKVL